MTEEMVKLNKKANLAAVIAKVNEIVDFVNVFDSMTFDDLPDSIFDDVLKGEIEPEDDGYGVPYRIPAIPGFPQPPEGKTYITFDPKELARIKKNKKGIFIKI